MTLKGNRVRFGGRSGGGATSADIRFYAAADADTAVPDVDYRLEAYSTEADFWGTLSFATIGEDEIYGVHLYEQNMRLRVVAIDDGQADSGETVTFSLNRYLLDPILSGQVKVEGKSPVDVPARVTLTGTATLTIND